MNRLTSILLCLFLGIQSFGQQAKMVGSPTKPTLQYIKKQCDTVLGRVRGHLEDFEKATEYSLLGLALTPLDSVAMRAGFAHMAGVAYYSRMHFDSAQVYFNLAMNEAIKSGDAEIINSAASALLVISLQTNNNEHNQKLLKIIKATIDTTQNINGRQKGYNGLGNYYYIKSFFATAQGYYNESIRINETLRDSSQRFMREKELAVQYYNLSKIYLQKKLFHKTLEALNQGSRYKDHSKAVQRRYYAAFVDAYTVGQPVNMDSALYYRNLIEKQVDTTKEVFSESVTVNLSLAQHFLLTKKTEQAKPYLELARTRAEASKMAFLLHQVNHLEGLMNYQEGDFAEAIKFLEKANPVSKQINQGNYLEGLHYLALSYAGLGNLNKAKSHYEEYIKTIDQARLDEQMRLFADMEVRYRTEEQERTIADLANQQRLNELELHNASRQKYFLVALLTGVGLVSLLLYRFYLQKERNNRLLNKKNMALDQLNHKLAIANESKARLLGIFSHDLRAPIGRIAQFLSLRKENPDIFTEENNAKYQSQLTEATENLLNTMEDLVVWSKSQMENFNPEITEVPLKPMIDEHTIFFAELIKEKEVRINNQVAPTLKVSADLNYLTIILRNLIQNALKYSRYQSDISISYQNRKLQICNQAYQAADAANLSDIMKGKRSNSRSNGMGLQLAYDLSARLNLELRFEVQSEKVCAVLEWPENL